MNGALTYASAAQHQADLRAAAIRSQRAQRKQPRLRRLPSLPRLRRRRRAFA